MKLLEDNTEENLDDFVYAFDILNTTPKPSSIKGTVGELDIIKITLAL